MAVTIFTAGGTFDTNAGNKSGVLGSIAIGDLPFAFIAATDCNVPPAVATFGATDNNPDGLSTYSKVLDVLDNGGVSQLTLVIRDAFLGSASATTMQTTGIPGGSSGGGFQAGIIRGLPTNLAGLSLIRQSGSQANIPSGTVPAVNLPAPMLPGNFLIACAVADTTAIAISGISGWSNFSSLTYTIPSFQIRGTSLISGAWVGTTINWANNPTSTMAALVAELNMVGAAVIANPDVSGFPKGSE